MTSKEKIHKLLAYALIAIRADAYEKEDKRMFALAHDFHNLPYKLSVENPDYDQILKELVENCSYKEVRKFMESNLNLWNDKS